ncbi:hypothetical protein chiPu_0025421 [Chiloscyllium punctatum]|uniref:Uncharacterized protein n=1 Tax=Chiloscyllium punctatum TaxID=137246 RepID=A0A401TF93_CHIPU|nr:hypothetical protein [Chiloscyllium punctatum]
MRGTRGCSEGGTGREGNPTVWDSATEWSSRRVTVSAGVWVRCWGTELEPYAIESNSVHTHTSPGEIPGSPN